MAEKIQKPCYFFNTGGCYHSDGKIKTAEECKYLHVKVNEPLEKPQHLKPPCKYYHLRGHCKNPYCVFGHSELSDERWNRYFSTHNYPGDDYIKTTKFSWVGNQLEDDVSSSETNVNQVKAAILMMMLQMLNELPE